MSMLIHLVPSYGEAVTLSGMLALTTSLTIALRLRKLVVWKRLLPMLITSMPSSVSLGGTGIIIVVGVAMETMSQLKGQLTQKQYHGFLK